MADAADGKAEDFGSVPGMLTHWQEGRGINRDIGR